MIPRIFIISLMVLSLTHSRAQGQMHPKPSPAKPQPKPAPHAVFMSAIYVVESGGKLRPPDGDNGKAIGPFQIHYPYWRDAVKNHPELRKQGYQKCRDYVYAAKVVRAYLERYAPRAWQAGDWQTLARIHNGGPDGYKETATLGYWGKVQGAFVRG